MDGGGGGWEIMILAIVCLIAGITTGVPEVESKKLLHFGKFGGRGKWGHGRLPPPPPPPPHHNWRPPKWHHHG
ncbi:hypothetical protein Phum_PHUM607250 [Pediculus humanus corporis]|uniref:Uncharacterized protein n=1 Tax=Pediculus humanus subsp. corporis TaxID=121224 RepID=E0W3M5_PEDHC|nr:uncharacterized protein Phum_PHUM607250 [Pediculus humanus corporis]EEB20231.1 hypothetical protein Phum_PHUM607250 [Pediculus humanus corporis]